MPLWITLLAQHGVIAFVIELSRYLIIAGGLAALLWIGTRWAEARRIQLRMPNGADRWHEVTNSLRTVAVFAASSMIVFALVRAGIIHVSLALPPWWVALIEFAVIVLAHDTWFYWMHRGLHLRALFRRAHATHHQSRAPTPWASYSFAPIEAVFEAAFLPLFLLAVPFHGIMVLAFLLHQLLRNALAHLGHELMPSGFTRSRWTGWLTTTTHHDLHHSEGRHNFGFYFTWWDRLMGTEHPHYHDRFEAVVARRRLTQEAASA